MKLKRFGEYHWYISDVTAARFDAFTSKHPYIYTILLDLLAEYQAANNQHACSITFLWNRMRWELQVNIEHHEEKISEKELGYLKAIGGYKFNDSITPGYARMIMANNPHLKGVFETRCPVYCPVCPKKRKGGTEK